MGWGVPADINATWRKLTDTKDNCRTIKDWSGVNRSGLIKWKLFMASLGRERGLASSLLENYRARFLTLLHSKQTRVCRKMTLFFLSADKELASEAPVLTLPSACILCFTTKQQCDCCFKSSHHLIQLHAVCTQVVCILVQGLLLLGCCTLWSLEGVYSSCLQPKWATGHVNFTQKAPEDLNMQPSCCECSALQQHAGCRGEK